MKVYNQRAKRIAHEIAREAVEGGSKNGFNFDWDCAMLFLKIAYGYAPIDVAPFDVMEKHRSYR